MDSMVQEFLSSLILGDMRQHKNVVMVPLFSNMKTDFFFLTLNEALDKGLIQVAEKSDGGSVPELAVINSGDIPILLLDGEELVGAKQNRVLNTSILILGHRQVLIPVSCCERGRWKYSTKNFSGSEAVMPAPLRQKKLGYVNNSLKRMSKYNSQQGDVWNDIRGLADRSGIDSPTEAMQDVFKARASDLAEYLQAFEWQSGQKGSLFFLNGEILGLDLIPLESAYRAIHSKLVRSYTLDAWPAPASEKFSMDRAKAFLEKVWQCKESCYSSPGSGLDLRYEGNGMAGSALKYEANVIHAAFFQTGNPSENVSGLVSFKRRSSHHRSDEGRLID